MVKLHRYLTGFRPQGGSKMRHVLLWFIFTGVARGTFSAAEISKNPEHSQISSNFLNGESTLAISATKSNSENSVDDRDFKLDFSSDRMTRHVPLTKIKINDSSESLLESKSPTDKVHKIRINPLNPFIFPYVRPTKKLEELKNDDTILVQPDYASGNELRDEHVVFKRSDTVIPMVRFGRTSLQKRQGNSLSVIPYPRVGRSLNQNEDEVNKNGKYTGEMIFSEKNAPEEEDETIYKDFEDVDDNKQQIQKRYMEDYDSMIPYPRPGREYSLKDLVSDLSERRADEEYTDYILPQIRYGRSMLLLSPPILPKTEETVKTKSPHTFVLPYPRPGRSNKNIIKVTNAKTKQLNLPYLKPELFENQRYVIPSARLGRSTLGTLYGMDGKDRAYSNDETFIGLKVNPFLLKGEENILSDKVKEKGESDSAFVIPYPRPGKKSMFKTGKEKANSAEKEITDYIVPYPRPGKKSTGQKSLMVKNNNYNDNQDIPAQMFVLPYPRPGRSIKYSLDSDVEFNMKNINPDEHLLDRMFKTNADIQEIIENIKSEDINKGKIRDFFEPLEKKYENRFMIPNARVGRSFDNVVPYPRLGRSTEDQFRDDEAYALDESGDGTSIFKVDYSDFEEVNSAQRLKRSTLVVPHHRIARSVSVVPYPRLGRADVVLPYSRLGRSDTIVPYPRFGKSNSVVPYPRPGRSNTVIPFPRPGRSSNVIPYPRPGRSNTVVPFPRPGRSSNVIPYPRPGRSGSVVLYPRPGRSGNIVPYPRPGRSGNMVPYPRPGRSGNVVPYPRPGRSNNIIPYPRAGKSLSVVPYPRLGRSEKSFSIYKNKQKAWFIPKIRPARSSSKREDSYVLPYPRPGRSEHAANDEMYNLKEERSGNELMIPYPRFGRSTKRQGYVLPQPRMGRSEDDEEDSVNDDTVIPNSHLDRSQEETTLSPSTLNSIHKLNKHMLSSVDESIYLLPYPRPGRYSE